MSTMPQDINRFSSGLGFIPEEILTRVVECLDWKDVLRFRLTCKRFHRISTAKSVWEGLLERHQQKSFPSLRVLEKPAQFYTSEELEQLFLHWMKVERAWLKNKSDLKQTWFSPPESLVHIYLLRGGRWLLCCDLYGEVSYCDVGAETLKFDPLIPAPDYPDPPRRMILMSVDEDWASPLLSFNIAICSTSCVLHDNHEPTYIDIWGGTLVLDDQHKSLGLKAEHLFHVPISPILMLPSESVSLLGSYVALDVGPMATARKGSIIIVDWKKSQAESRCSSKTLVYNRQVFSMKATIQLLPDNRILLKLDLVYIFDHSQIPEDSSGTSDQIAPLTFRKDNTKISVYGNALHTIACTGDHRFVRWDDRGIWGLSLYKEGVSGD